MVFSCVNETLRQKTALQGQSEGHYPCQYPKCKTGATQAVEILPHIRSPYNVFYSRTEN